MNRTTCAGLCALLLACGSSGGDAPASTSRAQADAAGPLPRIGIRVGSSGYGEFYDTSTGATFMPRGNVYFRVDPSYGPGTTTFVPGAYDPVSAESALSAMQSDGYNVVR